MCGSVSIKVWEGMGSCGKVCVIVGLCTWQYEHVTPPRLISEGASVSVGITRR